MIDPHTLERASEPMVKVETENYHGNYIQKRKQPAEFGVTEVIKGWTEVLQLMPVGSKWKVFIPSDIAYGDRGAGADIGPGSTLIFDIELLDIVK